MGLYTVGKKNAHQLLNSSSRSALLGKSVIILIQTKNKGNIAVDFDRFKHSYSVQRFVTRSGSSRRGIESDNCLENWFYQTARDCFEGRRAIVKQII